jgi:glucosyl-dolichyl phosphate glucuronosyltransferase
MQSASATNPNTISVIICTYNRAQSLRGTLRSLSMMFVPADLDWEVLVVDNNSTDGTCGVVMRFTQSSEMNVRYLFEGCQGLDHARNAGVKAAKGKLLFFLDDDVEVAKNWLLEMKKAFDLYPVVGVGGRVLLKKDLLRPPWWIEEYDNALGKFDAGDSILLSDDTNHSTIGIGANLSFKRSVFDQCGGFHPTLDRYKRKLCMGGDTEFARRVEAAGGLLMYYPAAVVHHCADSDRVTKSYLRRWYFRIGEWEAHKTLLGQNRTHAVFAVPRWHYRKMLEHLWRAVSLTLRGRRREGFSHELQGMSSLGYLFGALKNSLRTRIPAKGEEHGPTGYEQSYENDIYQNRDKCH